MLHSHYRDIHFIVVVWNWTHKISDAHLWKFFLVRLYELVDLLSYISGIHLNFVHRSIVHTVSGVTIITFIVIKSPWKMPMIYRLYELQEKSKAKYSYTQLTWQLFGRLICVGLSRIWRDNSWMNKCITNVWKMN